eukprot:4919232-Amphidinium_carterae.1
MDDPGMIEPSKPGGDDQWDTPRSRSDGRVTGEIPPVLDGLDHEVDVDSVDSDADDAVAEIEESTLPALPGPDWFPGVTDESCDFGTHRPKE